MRTVISGPVTVQHVLDAALFAGIEPTAFIRNGSSLPPAMVLPTTTVPPDPMVVGEVGVAQNHWRMTLYADALICVGENPHLVSCAEKNDLLVYQVAG